MRRNALPVLANVLKAWALVLGTCAFLGAIGFAGGGYRLLSILVFSALLLAGGAYWYSDRVALGLVGARELPLGEAPVLHSTVEWRTGASPSGSSRAPTSPSATRSEYQ